MCCIDLAMILASLLKEVNHTMHSLCGHISIHVTLVLVYIGSKEESGIIQFLEPLLPNCDDVQECVETDMEGLSICRVLTNA
jgi:hypothetical protein